VDVALWHDDEKGVDMAAVHLRQWHGAGTNRTLYHGPVSGAEPVK